GLVAAEGSPRPIQELVASARSYAEASKSPRTRTIYRLDFETFVAWCKERRLVPLPAAPETVAIYLAHRADRGSRPLSIGRMLTSISQAHKHAGYPSPRSATVV